MIRRAERPVQTRRHRLWHAPETSRAGRSGANTETLNPGSPSHACRSQQRITRGVHTTPTMTQSRPYNANDRGVQHPQTDPAVVGGCRFCGGTCQTRIVIAADELQSRGCPHLIHSHEGVVTQSVSRGVERSAARPARVPSARCPRQRARRSRRRGRAAPRAVAVHPLRGDRPHLVHDRRWHTVRRLPVAGRATRVVWRKRLLACLEACGTCVKRTPPIAHAAVWSRAAAWVAVAISQANVPIEQIRESYRAGWHTVMRAMPAAASHTAEPRPVGPTGLASKAAPTWCCFLPAARRRLGSQSWRPLRLPSRSPPSSR